MIAAGFINACKLISTPLKKQKFVFFGAGSAGIGVAQAIVSVLEEHGLSNLEARRRFWLVDSHVFSIFEMKFSCFLLISFFTKLGIGDN